MTDNEEYVADQIRLAVQAGFADHSDIDQLIDDIAGDDCDIAALKALVGPALRAKARAERGWPAVTDCDRLDHVFFDLHEVGICALANAGHTMSDGHGDVAQALHEGPAGHYIGYCFYHGQDVERAVEGHGVMIAFGACGDDPGADVQVGHVVARALRAAGFVIDWNATHDMRINLPVFDWKRRSTRVPPPNHG